jgi:hypothetical protein
LLLDNLQIMRLAAGPVMTIDAPDSTTGADYLGMTEPDQFGVGGMPGVAVAASASQK